LNLTSEQQPKSSQIDSNLQPHPIEIESHPKTSRQQKPRQKNSKKFRNNKIDLSVETNLEPSEFNALYRQAAASESTVQITQLERLQKFDTKTNTDNRDRLSIATFSDLAPTVEGTGKMPIPGKEFSSHLTEPENHSTPVRGYATGGQVTAIAPRTQEPIVASDTVPAMLTPGEFIVNAKDTEKNLDLLQHINSGGDVTSENLPQIASIPTNPASPETPTKVEIPSAIVQRRSKIPPLTPVFESSPTPTAKSVDSAPSQQIFSQSQPTVAPATPSQWSSVEDLLQTSLEPSNFDLVPTVSFTRGVGEKFLPETIQPTQTVTETITRHNNSEAAENDEADLEILAREVYHRLRQKLAIERERYGLYSGRLPW
jgi:hypothetical protein